MRKSKLLFVFLMAAQLFFSACDKYDLPYNSRSFYMGVTPWPSDFTKRAVDQSYQFINNHCDIVSHHFDEGIPWEEASRKLPYPQKLLDNLAERKSKTAPGKKVLLSVAALSMSRTDRAGYYGDRPDPVIADNWAKKTFRDSTVINAYINFIEYLAVYLDAGYINFGVESNSKDWKPEAFADYKIFIEKVYQGLKTRFPDIPLFVSFMVAMEPAYLENARQLEPYTDLITISAYPYSYIGSPVYGSTSPKLIPEGLFPSFADINPGKPFAVAETGYIAQDLDLSMMHKKGTEQWQADYIDYLFEFCRQRKAKFIIWFCAYDYDAAVNTFKALGLSQELVLLWKDTGFYDEKQRGRLSLLSWKKWFNLELVP